MLKALKALFGGAQPEARTEPSPREAAATLLVETALADGVYADREQDRIRQAIASAFNLDEAETAALLETAECYAEAAVDHYRFTKVVKEQMPLEERETLMEHLWTVAMADGEQTADEESFIRRIGPLLAVTDRARVLARKRAEASERSGD